MTESKDTNPKDTVGIRKVPISTVSAPVVAEIGLAMLEGARKYGRHNYRVAGVRASVYYDACVGRHLAAWWEGEDIDPASGLSHITKALACLVVLRDSMIIGNWEDDRPPKMPAGWVEKLNEQAGRIIDSIPDGKPPFTQKQADLVSAVHDMTEKVKLDNYRKIPITQNTTFTDHIGDYEAVER